MKRWLSVLLVSILCLGAFLPSFADGYEGYGKDNQRYDGSILSKQEIEKRTLELGQKIAYDKSNPKVSTRDSGENWVLNGTPVELVPEYVYATKCVQQLSVNQTKTSTVGFSITVGSKIKTFGLDVAFSSEKTDSFTGPSFSDKVAGTSLNATGSSVTGAQRIKLMKYSYKVYDKYSGNFLRNVTQNAAVNCGTTLYNQRNNTSLTSFTIENVNRTKSKVYKTLNEFASFTGVGKTSALFF